MARIIPCPRSYCSSWGNTTPSKMGPASAKLALELQIKDVDDIFAQRHVSRANDEATALRVVRLELVKMMGEFEGQIAAVELVRKERGEREAHGRLLVEERQAQDQPDVMDIDVTPMAIDLGGTQTEYAVPVNNRKRPAEEDSETLRDKTAGAVKRRLISMKKEKATTRDEVPFEPARPIVRLPRPAAMSKSGSLTQEQTTSVTLAASMFPSPTIARMTLNHGTGGLPFQPFMTRINFSEREVLCQTITCDRAYAEYSLEELRVVDYAQGRRRSTLGTDEYNHTEEYSSIIDCSCCLDGFEKADILILPCPQKKGSHRHAYCRICLRKMFEAAIADSLSFPPRCCHKPLELNLCRPLLLEDVIARFEKKKEELSVSDGV
ncbi:hypothetical protein BU23DRAFT_632365 [Bimuria novae-zelandiae CBS 107.79]|uniref:RING-type domain-containing protein n=1 Tax=Bimuria novae-zelandiae CBS 107.79 TaxID=1447943 RepID=A0A6A5VG68_9PLEO|nr:hypothetical protein BU23DRAFT_632365 [Bimuria novae-zelandiae CBS 107.79]